jgi:2-polyprenyl-3-methyl-5-hydroxy-6-metoxy-1,4-benzoquinol methylase
MYFYTIEIEVIKPTFFYDTSTDKIMNYEEFKKIKENIIEQLLVIKTKKQHIFKDYLDTFDTKIHDKFYQDIECIDFIGYSKSSETWKRIKDLVDWKNKTVIDLGCYHGYFSFKAEQAGATNIIGLEKWEGVLDTTNMIKHMLHSNVIFQIWDAGEVTPIADVALVLNILHHAKDPEQTLQNINAKVAIFEVEKSQIDLIKKYFEISTEIESHRVDSTQNRIILVGNKKC